MNIISSTKPATFCPLPYISAHIIATVVTFCVIGASSTIIMAYLDCSANITIIIAPTAIYAVGMKTIQIEV